MYLHGFAFHSDFYFDFHTDFYDITDFIYRLPLMFRRLYDVYGTKASSLYPDYFPIFDLKYVTSSDIKDLVIAFGKWK